jgi:hypothetical protein
VRDAHVGRQAPTNDALSGKARLLGEALRLLAHLYRSNDVRVVHYRLVVVGLGLGRRRRRWRRRGLEVYNLEFCGWWSGRLCRHNLGNHSSLLSAMQKEHDECAGKRRKDANNRANDDRRL